MNLRWLCSVAGYPTLQKTLDCFSWTPRVKVWSNSLHCLFWNIFSMQCVRNHKRNYHNGWNFRCLCFISENSMVNYEHANLQLRLFNCHYRQFLAKYIWRCSHLVLPVVCHPYSRWSRWNLIKHNVENHFLVSSLPWCQTCHYRH